MAAFLARFRACEFRVFSRATFPRIICTGRLFARYIGVRQHRELEQHRSVTRLTRANTPKLSPSRSDNIGRFICKRQLRNQ